MPRTCEICGKQTRFGNAVARRGRAKYLGGVGVKITGVTRRKFVPNLQRVRVKTANGTVKRMTICTQCIRGGKVTKPPPRPKLEAKS
jgi:large subunit ribosomal protein L28